MHHYAAVVLFCLLSSVGTIVRAQSDSKTFSAGFGLQGGIPASSTGYHFDGGLTVRLSYHAGPGFVTLSSGVVAWIPKSFQGSTTKASLQIPVLVGYKYVFAKPFFVMGEVGYSSFRVYYKGDDNNVASSTYGGFTYAPTIGVTFKALELGIRYESTSLNGGTASAIGLKVAFNF